MDYLMVTPNRQNRVFSPGSEHPGAVPGSRLPAQMNLGSKYLLIAPKLSSPGADRPGDCRGKLAKLE